jgi:hypothetical protein
LKNLNSPHLHHHRLKADNVLNDWAKWLDILKEKDSLLAAKLQHVAPTSYKDKRLDLAISKGHEFLVTQLQKETEHLAMYFAELTGLKLDIHFSIQQNEQTLTPKQVADKTKQQEDDSIRQTIESDPLFMATKEIFKPKTSTIKELK